MEIDLCLAITISFSECKMWRFFIPPPPSLNLNSQRLLTKSSYHFFLQFFNHMRKEWIGSNLTKPGSIYHFIQQYPWRGWYIHSPYVPAKIFERCIKPSLKKRYFEKNVFARILDCTLVRLKAWLRTVALVLPPILTSVMIWLGNNTPPVSTNVKPIIVPSIWQWKTLSFPNTGDAVGLVAWYRR